MEGYQGRAQEYLRVSAFRMNPPEDDWQRLLHKDEIAKFVEMAETHDKDKCSEEIGNSFHALIAELETAVSASNMVLDHISTKPYATIGPRACSEVCTMVGRVYTLVLLTAEYAIKSLNKMHANDGLVGKRGCLERIIQLTKAGVGKARVTYAIAVGCEDSFYLESELFDRLETEAVVPANALDVRNCKQKFQDAYDDLRVEEEVLAVLGPQETRRRRAPALPRIDDNCRNVPDQPDKQEESSFLRDCFSRCCGCLLPDMN